MSTAVVKIGGSLLSRPDLPQRLARLFDQLPADNILCLVGGGPAADIVRNWDATHRLGEETAHWLAIDSLALTARLVERLVPDAELIRTRAQAADCWGRHRIAIVDPLACIPVLEQEAAVALPHCWDATTDSIAAWIAREWPAERLVLAKSIPPPESTSQWSESSAVDPFFSTMLSDDTELFWSNVAGDSELVDVSALHRAAFLPDPSL